MRCNGLPNAYDPSDLRKYMHMWSLEMAKQNETEQNWLLHANERSVLTQDQTVSNITRSFLSNQQPNLGDIYSERTVEILGVTNILYILHMNIVLIVITVLFLDFGRNPRSHQ